MYFFRIKGRLGNQMFIYAAAKAFKLRNPKTEVFFNHFGNLRLFQLSTADNWINHNYGKLIRKIKNRGHNKFPLIDLNNNNVIHSDLKILQYKNGYPDGYFQSEEYFKIFKNEITKYFTPKIKHQLEFEKIKDKYFKSDYIIAIHIRRTDFVNGGYDENFLNGPDLSLPLSYYHKAIKRVLKPNATYIFLSDDINYARKHFSELGNSLFSNNSEIIDMQIMMNADVIICSNSTFSWWGAWLNKKKEPRIIVPENFLGFKVGYEYPVKILPEKWEKIKI